jgi:alpha-L-rhamnosidase
MLENGATTTWENWSNPRSYIHNCFNGIGSWFYQAIGGIRMDNEYPAYQHVVIQPQIIDKITWANTTKETPYGRLAVNWKVEGSEFRMQLEIPVGVYSKVVIPEGIHSYILNNKELAFNAGESLELPGGKYNLSYKVNK